MRATKTRKPNVMLLFGWNDPEGFQAVSDYAMQHGWHLELRAYFTDNVPEHWEGDGILYSMGNREPIDHFVLQQASRCPVVSLNANLPAGLNAPVVTVDNAAAGRLAAKHLLERGHRDFLYFSPVGGAVADERRRGFAEVVSQAGHRLYEFQTQSLNSQTSWPKMRARLAARLDKLPAQLGILALDDLVAADLIEVALDSGRQVPGELAVVGMGNIRTVCECAQVPITSIDVRSGTVARCGAELLGRLMRGKTPPDKPLMVEPGALVARESSNLTVARDPRLAKAVTFFQKNLRQAFSLEDAAGAAGVSRRTLYHLFRDELATTPADYLRRERTQLAARLMHEQPGLTQRQAASLTGFSCTRSLNRSLHER